MSSSLLIPRLLWRALLRLWFLFGACLCPFFLTLPLPFLCHQQMITDTALGMMKRVIVDRRGSFSPLYPLNVQAASVPCTSEKARKAQTGHVDTILALWSSVGSRRTSNLHYTWCGSREACVRTLAWTMDFTCCVDVLHAYFCHSLGLKGLNTVTVGPF